MRAHEFESPCNKKQGKNWWLTIKLSPINEKWVEGKWKLNIHVTVGLVNQILAYQESHLHRYLISFTSHLFNSHLLNPFYYELRKIQFLPNKEDLRTSFFASVYDRNCLCWKFLTRCLSSSKEHFKFGL